MATITQEGVRPEITAPPSPFREFWSTFSQNRGALAGLIVITALVLTAIFADVLAPHSPIEQFRDAFLTPPVWDEGGTTKFLLGTDPIGRDILSRLIYGARLSLFIGFIVVTISLAAGIVLGLVSGFFRGTVDFLIMRAMDVILAVPSLLMALVIIAILDKGLGNAMIAIAITVVPNYARLVRSSVLSELNKEYVIASRVSGAGLARLMFITVLPNCVAPLIVQASLGFSGAILDAAALGFLGLGAQPPTPEWGTMLAGTLEFLERAPWVVNLPGITILVTVLAFNLMGDGLRDALDPRLKR
jgi:dipeptide transport system permease protein